MTKSEKSSIAVLITLLILECFSAGIIFKQQQDLAASQARNQAFVRDVGTVFDKTIDDMEETGRASVNQSSAVEVEKKAANDEYDAEIQAAYEAQLAAEAEAARIAQQQTYTATTSAPSQSYSNGGSFQADGVWYDDSYRYTWYSSNAAYHYRTLEWTAGSDGIYRDSEGYVVVASSDLPQGTVVEDTPFGAAKVYDSGCASGTLDVYTNY